MSRRKSLLNQRFGSLVVTADAGRNAYGNSQWVCACDCGEETIALYQHLTTGRTKSCGCGKRKKRSRKPVFVDI